MATSCSTSPSRGPMKVPANPTSAQKAYSRGGMGKNLSFPGSLATQSTRMSYSSMKISRTTGSVADMAFQEEAVGGVSRVSLPIPTGINVGYAQAWNDQNVNMMQGAVANMLTKDNRGSQMVDAMLGKDGGRNPHQDSFSQQMAAAGEGGAGGISKFLASMGIENVGNAVAGTVLGTAGSVLSAGVVQAGTGVAAFEQVMAVYSGPAFRNFNFNYAMRPLNAEDAQMIQDIVEFFKVASAPDPLMGGLYRIYDLPLVFQIKYHHLNGEYEKQINKIAHCALTNIGINYGGQRWNTFADDQNPVEVNLALSFREIEMLDRRYYQEGY